MPGLLCEAEQALLLGDFGGAWEQSAQCLAKGGGSDSRERDRALAVALQAAHELHKLPAARQLLRECTGERLQDAPADIVLLWLALALDWSDQAGEARRTIQALLDPLHPGWTQRQHLALVHLYAFEVLLAELREPAEVMRWVQETRLPLAPGDRQLLIAELERVQQARAATLPLGGGSHADSDDDEGGGGEGEGQGWLYTRLPAVARRRAQQRAQSAAQRSGGGAAGVARAAAGESEIQPAEADEAAAEGRPFGEATFDWLGRCQRTVQEVASAVLSPLLDSFRHGANLETERRSGGGDSSSSRAAAAGEAPAAKAPPPELLDSEATLQLLGGAAIGAVLLYSAWAERQSLRRGAGRARRAVAAGAIDLFRMAFSLSPNPMAVVAPS